MRGDGSHLPAPRACVIGWPIQHSRSPLIHGYWLSQLGLAGRYDKLAVKPENLSDFLDTIGTDGLRGCNVTVPHKVGVFDHLEIENVSEAAQAIGAINTLWFEDGQLHGTNTDASGFMMHLRFSAPSWSDDAGPAVVIGAGGAARAIVYGLREAGVAEIRVVNRTVERAEALATDFGGTVKALPFSRAAAALEDAALLVNTSSLGMHGCPPLNLDLSRLDPSCVVADIVYVPLETDLLDRARAKGCPVVDGLGMLLHQAVPGFELWFGKRPEVTRELRAVVVKDLQAS